MSDRKSNKRYLCTYFDINFLPRGLALLNSLSNNSNNFILYILALDSEVEEYFVKKNLDNVQLITLVEYSKYFEINESKFESSKEFYFSLTPSLCLYILKKHPNIDLLVYLDADVYLFDSLEILYDEIGDASISMCEHRLPWYLKYISKNYGIYNVGINAFRNDREANKCLEQWYIDCSTWTKNQKDYPLSFFSDQIWLDNWPKLYKNIKIIDHIGINTAPWNAIQYSFSLKGNQYFVNNVPLVIFHFSSLKLIDPDIWHGNTSFTLHNIKGNLYDIYVKYIENVELYEFKKNNSIIELNYSGNKLKLIVYKIMKFFHNHIIIKKRLS